MSDQITVSNLTKKFHNWFFQWQEDSIKAASHHQSHWLRVMCLTGVDYFSSLGYAPGIAFLAAGIISPFATLVLVALMLFGALPMYWQVASRSPHGQGSIAMLEKLLPGWSGKALVLVLLGFAGTDFIITITLSAADAAAHLAENKFVQEFCATAPSYAFLQNKVFVTTFMITVLGVVFLKGFREAIGIAVVLVAIYLLLNLLVCSVGCFEVWQGIRSSGADNFLAEWWQQLCQSYKSPFSVLTGALLVFPQLALGMSGFETGVAVMPLIKGLDSDSHETPVGRIYNTKKMLFTAAFIMSIFLCVSSFITVFLIPASQLHEGGSANGRALSYIAHLYLGNTFGTFYDVSTITILWFAGASAMAGLLSLMPRYLPRYGMAPDWAKCTRPLVCFLTLVALFVTWYFKASVDAQGAAYATGVLVLMSSAAYAVFLAVWKQGLTKRCMYGVIFLIFAYTTAMNMRERPEGVHIALLFIACIFVSSIFSRIIRSTELRIGEVNFDAKTMNFLEQMYGKTIRIMAHKPGFHDYSIKEQEIRELHNLHHDPIIFLEVTLADASDFQNDILSVSGIEEGKHHILRCQSAAIPNAMAAVLLHVMEITGKRPHVYLQWTEGNPVIYVLRYLFWGDGETAAVLREVLREAVPEQKQRPRVHVA